MVIAFIIISSLLISALTLSVSANIRFGKMLMNVEDNTQTCLDIIDKRFHNLMHVFDDSSGRAQSVIGDDPMIRSFFKEVESLRNDVLKIANLISRSTEQLSNSDEKEALALGSSPSEAQSDTDGFLIE